MEISDLEKTYHIKTGSVAESHKHPITKLSHLYILVGFSWEKCAYNL